ncbi:MAG: CocE/NonD family hydrolase [Candidatus Lokiarchaeota archaeon]|nr:CocE/NonD family hydrolase [Candidatus Lokiarchaeota archaeon]
MSKSEKVTDLNYLNIKVKPSSYSILIKLLERLLENINPIFLRFLGLFMGLGKLRDNVFKYPECYLRMKDGTNLSTNVYLPRKVCKDELKCPTILIRLPYWKDSYLKLFGYVFSSYGYAVVIQDLRGCARSEGFNFIFMKEREDGFDTIKWIKNQFWYNNKIGMFGASYFGITKFLLAWGNDVLDCINPAISSFSNVWKNQGGLNLYGLSIDLYRILLTISLHEKKPPVDILTKEIRDMYLNPKLGLYNDPFIRNGEVLKFSDLKNNNIKKNLKILSKFCNTDNIDLTKRNFNIFFRFLEVFLKSCKDTDLLPGFNNFCLEEFYPPTFMLAGWQDMFLESQLSDFLKIKQKSNQRSKKNSRLVIGPWGHLDKGHPEGNIKEFLKYLINLEWYDYWLMDNKKAYKDLDKPSIKYYVIGKKLWRYTENWPPNKISYKKMFLHSQGNANTLKGDGYLDFAAPSNIEYTDAYIFDPLNPVITKGGRNLSIRKGSHDQEESEIRDDVLVYTSRVLEKGIEITGPVRIVLFASSSAVDTDFLVKLVDVDGSNNALNILDGGIRTRFRKDLNNPSQIKPDEIIRYDIELGNISLFFKPKHRIRLEISSSNFPRYDINSNLGGKGEPGEFIKAKQKIFHDASHPSHLILPIFKTKTNIKKVCNCVLK